MPEMREMDREKAPFHLQVGPALGTAGGAEQGGGWEPRGISSGTSSRKSDLFILHVADPMAIYMRVGFATCGESGNKEWK